MKQVSKQSDLFTNRKNKIKQRREIQHIIYIYIYKDGIKIRYEYSTDIYVYILVITNMYFQYE